MHWDESAQEVYLSVSELDARKICCICNLCLICSGRSERGHSNYNRDCKAEVGKRVHIVQF